MSLLRNIVFNLPEVVHPSQRKLSFKEKLKWTGLVLLLFFTLQLIPLFGLGQNALSQFEFLSIILGAEFGSVISLGIGPLVTASIVLQLLKGSGILKIDTTTTDGKAYFQGIQKLTSIFFIVFEAIVYVFLGGMAPPETLTGTSMYLYLELLLIFQLMVGGILIMFMDEIVSKWGFGSGISLFIAAGVSKSIFIRAFAWNSSEANPGVPIGAVPQLFYTLPAGEVQTSLLLVASIVATVIVFVMAVYVQAMKVEIPLSFGRVRGQSIRWPLNFIYTSNIPVILVAALMANIQLWSTLIGGQGNRLATFVQPPNLAQKVITGSLVPMDILQATIYLIVFIAGCIMFSYFWMQTSGMDAKSQAKQIMSSGLQIPGFRKDPRVMENLLNRYILPLTIMGAMAVGLLAAFADLLGALGNGTGIMLAVMIIYKLYEEIAKDHMMDMHPMLKKVMK